MGVRGCSEHAEDLHFPLRRLAGQHVPMRPHAAPSPTGSDAARLAGCWGCSGASPGLAASNWALAPVLRRGSPRTLSRAPARPEEDALVRAVDGCL